MTGSEEHKTRTTHLVLLSRHDDRGGMLFEDKESAEAAKEWFKQESNNSISAWVVPMQLHEGFEPPEDFYANYLGWDYNAE